MIFINKSFETELAMLVQIFIRPMALLYKLIILPNNKIIHSRQKQNKIIIITFLSPDEKSPLHHSFA